MRYYIEGRHFAAICDTTIDNFVEIVKELSQVSALEKKNGRLLVIYHCTSWDEKTKSINPKYPYCVTLLKIFPGTLSGQVPARIVVKMGKYAKWSETHAMMADLDVIREYGHIEDILRVVAISGNHQNGMKRTKKSCGHSDFNKTSDQSAVKEGNPKTRRSSDETIRLVKKALRDSYLEQLEGKPPRWEYWAQKYWLEKTTLSKKRYMKYRQDLDKDIAGYIAAYGCLENLPDNDKAVLYKKIDKTFN